MEGDKPSFFIAFAVVVIIAFIGYRYLSSPPEMPNTAPSPEPASSGNDSENKNPPQSGNSSDLQIITVKEGSGEGARSGDTITVNYTGMFTDGKVFDSSIPRGQPFVFKLGGGQVIQGWDRGLVGMKVGEKRKLTIPPALGYGVRGTPGGEIPPNATLIFEVEMLKIN